MSTRDDARRDEVAAVSSRERERRDAEADAPGGRPALVSSRTGIAEQRRRFGGLKWGAAFFGWLVATALAVLAIAVLSAAGVAVAVNALSTASAKGNAAALGVAGGVLLVAVLAVAYYAGGYVAGRLARFDGTRQGLGVWLIGVLVTLAFALAGVVAGSQYNVLRGLNLPNLPIGRSTATTGGVVAGVAALVATAIAACWGGKVGERYHRTIDRIGFGTADVEPF
jgi:hypothetical protein